MTVPSLRTSRLCGLTLLMCLVAGSIGCTVSEGAQERPPNIVLILADDMGYGDPQSYNPASKIPTPFIDQLAAEGVRLTDAHAPSAVCTPTRYGLLTGRYAWRTAMKQGVLVGYSPALIDTNRMTLASLLKQRGYATAGVGKWHLGLGTEEPVDYEKPLRPGPSGLGFDYYFGIPASLDMKPYGYFRDDRLVQALSDSTPDNLECCFGAFWRGGPMAPDFRHDQVLPDFTREAVAFLDRHAAGAPDQPFFLYMPLAAPHTPWVPTGDFVGRTRVGEYGDFTAQVDASVGDVMEALDRLNLTDQTLVIFASDNGAIWPQEMIDRFDHRANGPWRGQKADAYEGGHRVPFIARWPGHIPAGSTSDQLASLTDLMATFAAVAGAELPPNAGEDSFNLLPALLGQPRDEPVREAMIQHSSRGLFAVRQGPWKLIEGRGSGGFTEPVHLEPGPGEPAGQLYNLADDPAETTNLYQQHPDVAERLSALLARIQRQGHSRPSAGPDTTWGSLFDGHSFEGWDDTGNRDAFRIEDGAIVAGTLEAPILQNEFLCTVGEYADFTLRLKFKLLGDGANAGIQFRSVRIPNDNEVIGYQADMGDGWWGKLYDESRRNRVLAETDPAVVDGLVQPTEWNDYEIRAVGDRIRLAVNGTETIDYTEPDEDILQTGRICLQIHSGPPSEAWYKDIVVEPAEE